MKDLRHGDDVPVPRETEGGAADRTGLLVDLRVEREPGKALLRGRALGHVEVHAHRAGRGREVCLGGSYEHRASGSLRAASAGDGQRPRADEERGGQVDRGAEAKAEADGRVGGLAAD